MRCRTRRCGHTRSRLADRAICQVDELIDAADNEIAQFCRSLNSATFSSEAEPVAPLALLEALSDQHRQTIGQIDNLKVPSPTQPPATHLLMQGRLTPRDVSISPLKESGLPRELSISAPCIELAAALAESTSYEEYVSSDLMLG